jgi:dienelactone hydrolase
MAALRENIRSFLRLSPALGRPEVLVVDEEKEDGFTRSLLRYLTADDEPIEAFLFQPANIESRGAVLALHQHNSQWAIGKSEIAGLAGDPIQALGPALARRGVTVLAPDAIGFESRMKAAGDGRSLSPPLQRAHSTAEGWLQYYNQMAYRLVRGELLMTKLLEDCATGLSVLQEHTNISRLGVVGHSFGGVLTLFLAALDTRVAFACSSGAVCSFRHKLAAGTGLELSLVIPAFAAHYDFDDLLRCVAPRTIFVVSSDDDPYSADAEELIRNALPEFASQHGADRLQHLRVPGPHALDRTRFEAIVDWTVAQGSQSQAPA